MKKLFAIIGLAIFCNMAWSQTTSRILPRGFAQGEQELMCDYIQEMQNRSVLACELQPPPNVSMRSMAEWEELQAIVIAWTSFPQILAQIVRHAKEEVEVIIVTTNPGSVQSYLTGQGIDWSTNVSFIDEDYDSIWIRDYGPNTVYQNDVGQLSIVDWIYNRPRPLDDQIPIAVADYLGIPIMCTVMPPNDLVHTGGNYMSDGLGNAFSSTLILEENDQTNQWGTSNHSETDIENIMRDFMGIESYAKMETLPWDVIHHIDMHMKVLDEETLLVGQYPEGIADGPQIEANLQYVLDNFTTAYGNPFKVVRIPMPPDANGDFPDYPGNSWWLAGDYRTYTNAVFVNETILVPTYAEQYDTTALQIWEEAMPGYNIVGIDCNEIIPLAGAIHCITKEVGVAEPLLINHSQPNDGCSDENIVLTASIKHQTGINSATLFYRTSLDLPYDSVEMNLGIVGEEWLGIIPALNLDGTLYYYFEAEANSGKVIQRPLVAPEGHFSFPITNCMPVATFEPIQNEVLLEEVFPNPASAITCIPLTSKKNLIGKLTLNDVLGQTIAIIHEGDVPAGESKYFIHASRYVPGTYFIQLETQDFTQTQKLIIQH